MENESPQIRRLICEYNRLQPDPILALFTFATMGQGILITIMGLGIATDPQAVVFGFLLAGFGVVLIVTQYASTFRRNRACLGVACSQLVLISLPLFMLLLIGAFVILIPLIISVTTLLLNISWEISLREQHAYLSEEEPNHQLTLREILGGILILALILGPASFFYR